eukprot:4186108-Pyramimonas_sp.AAC.2
MCGEAAEREPSRKATDEATAAAGGLDEHGENPMCLLAWTHSSCEMSKLTEPGVSGGSELTELGGAWSCWLSLGCAGHRGSLTRG